MINKLFAVVDIETTGGQANTHAITEIAIVITDGLKVLEKFETLINPEQDIPIFIQNLTGISNEMVCKAPNFKEVSQKIFNLLYGKIFVAHNVSFDYNFVASHLKKSGFILDSQKICTIKLARKVLPGYPSYSLGKLCKSLDIELENRHRAMGDAYATNILLNLIIAKDFNNDMDKLFFAKKIKQN